MKKANELVAFVKGKLGTPYVYGMKGSVMTQSAYDYLKRVYPSQVKDSDKYKVGKVCVDCSGLISWCTGSVRGSSQYKDTARKVLPISRISEAVPGCALWKQGHIGVYIGNGKCIEARGSAYGTVETNVSERPWTHILWLLDINYVDSVSPATVEEKKTAQEWANRYLKDEILRGDFPALDIDGALGLKSKQAFCRCLQKWLNEKKGAKLDVDGDFGPKTKAAIRFTLKEGASGIPVRVAQAMLMRCGYDPGSVNGHMDESTVSAVYAYKKDMYLANTKVVDAETYDSMF